MVDQNLNHLNNLISQKRYITYLIQSFCQVFSPILVRNITVSMMIVEKLRFALQRVAHAFFGVDVLLTAIDDTDEAQLQWIYTSSEDIQCICTCIHEVELSEYTNCAPALWIDGTGKLKRV